MYLNYIHTCVDKVFCVQKYVIRTYICESGPSKFPNSPLHVPFGRVHSNRKILCENSDFVEEFTYLHIYIFIRMLYKRWQSSLIILYIHIYTYKLESIFSIKIFKKKVVCISNKIWFRTPSKNWFAPVFH